MNLLVISPAPSSPANQGNRQRIDAVCKAFQERGAKIHYGYMPREWGGKYDVNEQVEMTHQWDFYDTIIPSAAISYAAKGEHHEIDEWWDEAIGRYVRYKCTGASFDACLVNYAFFSKAFEALPPNVIRILDTHDRLSGRRELLEQHGVTPDFFYTTEAEERIALDRADIILAITPNEAAHFRKLTRKPVITLGHRTKLQRRLGASAPIERVVRVGFIGSSNSVNNKNISEFFRALAISSPDGIPCVEFHIYGRCCSQIHIPAECKHYVWLHGLVDDVREFYESVDCVFVPFMFGTGQKIKLIEALSFGKPLIATASASEGCGLESHYHRLNTHEAVIEAIRRFVGDPGFRSCLSNESTEAFAAYEANIDRVASALFAAASSRMLQVFIEPTAVAAAFRERERAEMVDQVCRVLAMMDVIGNVGKITNREAAIRALFQAAEGLPAECIGEQIDRQTPSLMLADGPTPVIVGARGGDERASSATPEVRVILPCCRPAPNAPRSNGLELYVDCQPTSGRSGEGDSLSEIIRTPTPDHKLRAFNTFQQVVFLVKDIHSETLIAQIRLFEQAVVQRSGAPFSITAVDQEARCASWARGTLVQVDSSETLKQGIDRAREVPRKLHSIALAIGFSQTSATVLHRLMLADCGPMISLIRGRVIPVDGEVIARTTHEAALWVTRFLVSPGLANAYARRTRASVSAIEGADMQTQKLLSAFRAQQANGLASLQAELLSREV